MKESDQYTAIKAQLKNSPHTWLITGVAGFIGSNSLESLLRLNQQVIGLDNFSTGHQHNLDLVEHSVSADQLRRFQLITGDIRDLDEKYVNELYADAFARCYDFKTIGLRYFNIFGQRQDPEGAYAAVIPRWVASMMNNEPVYINGDGETSRDFCFIEHAVQANILAATTENEEALNQVYNVAGGDRTTLNQFLN